EAASLVPSFGFAQDDAEAAPAEAEALFDPAGHRRFAAVTGYAIVLAVDPHAPAAVVELKDAIPQRAKRVRDAACNGDIFPGKVAGIAVDVGNGGARWTAGKEKHCQGKCGCDQYPAHLTEHQIDLQRLFVWVGCQIWSTCSAPLSVPLSRNSSLQSGVYGLWDMCRKNNQKSHHRIPAL